MDANIINEIDDQELKNKLSDINKNIEKALKVSLDNLNTKMKATSQELKLNIREKKFQIILKYIKDPYIQINIDPKSNLNYIINPIILILANVKAIAKFTYSEKTQEILQRINGLNQENIIKYFYQLMIDMRNGNVPNPNFMPIHQFLKNNNVDYKSQDPGYWFNIILYQIEYNIDLVRKEDFKNIITNNFAMILNKKEKCGKCKTEKIASKEKILYVNLNLTSPKKYIDELNNVFIPLALGGWEKSQTKFCPKCKSNLSKSKSFLKMNKYLIINLNRKNDPNNNMKLTFLQNLIIFDESEKKQFEYELISALTNININSNYVENMNKYVIFFRNFVKNVWYKTTIRKNEIINGNILQEISNQNPNVLIYKKI